jgi:hypothetical protein
LPVPPYALLTPNAEIGSDFLAVRGATFFSILAGSFLLAAIPCADAIPAVAIARAHNGKALLISLYILVLPDFLSTIPLFAT